MKNTKILIILLMSILICIVSTGCSSLKREFKDIQSEVGGLNRVVTVYDYNGNVLKQYEGNIDIQENANGKVLFDLDGKRTIVYNAIVIVDEK